MRWIQCIAAEHAAGTYDSHGRFHLLHRPNLHGRCMRSKKHGVTNVERIARIPCWMACRKVQSIEVIERAFDLGTVLNRVAHGNENVFNFSSNDCQRMAMPNPSAIARQRD